MRTSRSIASSAFSRRSRHEGKGTAGAMLALLALGSGRAVPRSGSEVFGLTLFGEPRAAWLAVVPL